ncbi:hypothetical protein BOTBODRAFT_114868 [Botryobasidium botryosum FD-172 SS1]|uniref:HSF-type DNA-binding domain-containing protein n=1 Tax=Botryobasidium botryosum (strain FD-172 SS1) TaxID=930990 RepID=A0A067M5L0_BOTB1|nr:hypothetical protein BOTBODRAFT_114868 [Botryobasidium botryosum FD-172 SS1]
MINNPETDEFIYWAPDGKSFFVSNQEYFSRELLPKSFRHKNFASFVRQLNMYGFRKIPQLHQGALKNETEAELCQFMNSRFQRGTLDLEGPIKRKKSAPDGITVGSVALQSLTNELGAIKRHQAAISSDLKELQESIQQLWHETFKSKDGQQQLQDTINKILKFLAGMFGKSAGAAGSTTQTAGMPTNGGFVVMPRKNARLMIDDGKDEERQVSVNLSEMDDIVETNLPGMSEDSDMLSESADGGEWVHGHEVFP